MLKLPRTSVVCDLKTVSNTLLPLPDPHGTGVNTSECCLGCKHIISQVCQPNNPVKRGGENSLTQFIFGDLVLAVLITASLSRSSETTF